MCVNIKNLSFEKVKEKLSFENDTLCVIFQTDVFSNFFKTQVFSEVFSHTPSSTTHDADAKPSATSHASNTLENAMKCRIIQTTKDRHFMAFSSIFEACDVAECMV